MLANINISLSNPNQPQPCRALYPVYDWRSARAGDTVRATHANYTDISRVNLRKCDRVAIMKRYDRAGLSSGAIANKLGELAKALGVSHYWEILPRQMELVHALIDKQLNMPVRSEVLKTIEQAQPVIQRAQPLPRPGLFDLPDQNERAFTISEVVDCEELVAKALYKIALDLLKVKEAIEKTETKDDLEKVLKVIIKA